MKKIFLFLGLGLLSVSCSQIPVKPEPIACTQEAMQCPDGSYVSRTGPNCEFAACPQQSDNSVPPASTSTGSTPPVSGKPGVVCPQLAKVCPDGSYVTPQGPDCQVPACPSLNSGIQ